MAFNITDIKDIVLLLSSITTISFTLFTINKWKKEYRAKAYFECSYRFLKTVYSLRDNFAGLRLGFISPLEYPQPLDLSKKVDNMLYVINKRSVPFQEALNNYYSMLPEVEVLFKKETRDICGEVNTVVSNYYNSLSTYLQLEGNTNNFEYLAEIRKDVLNLSEDDKLKKDLNNIINRIETAISKYMVL